jgi:hypothetical protein
VYRGHAPLELFLEYHMRNIQHDNCCALYTAYTTLLLLHGVSRIFKTITFEWSILNTPHDNY